MDGVERQVAFERRQVRQAQAPSPKQASAMQSENPLRFQGSWSYVITFLSRPRRSGPPPPPPRHAAHRQPRARRWPAGCSHWSLPPAQRRRARPARPRPCRPLGRRTRRHTGRARTRPRTAGRRRCAAPHLPDPTRTRAGNLLAAMAARPPLGALPPMTPVPTMPDAAVLGRNTLPAHQVAQEKSRSMVRCVPPSADKHLWTC